MAKQIEEIFTIALGTTSIHITARNYNQHKFFLAYRDGDRAEGCMSVDEMKMLSVELMKIAEQIGNDKDFANNVR